MDDEDGRHQIERKCVIKQVVTKFFQHVERNCVMKQLGVGIVVLTLVLSMCGQGWAGYFNYSEFNISGTLAGTKGGAFPWIAADNAWEQGTGYAWPGKNAIMKYDYEAATPLTLTLSLTNGRYKVVVKDVFTNNSLNVIFPFTIQGQTVNVVAADSSAWTKDYPAGEFQVTNGTLTIIVRNPAVGTGAWLGFSGFDVIPMVPPVYNNYSDFNIAGTLAGTKGAAFPWASGDNAWEQGTGYAWPGKNAIMKYDNEMAAPLTLTMGLANGRYVITVKDVFTNNSANATFPFKIQGLAVNVVATDVNAWTKDYLVGEFEVTEGLLTIVVGNPYVGTGAWLGFTGFQVTPVEQPIGYYSYSDFNVTGTLAGTRSGAFPWAATDNAWEQGAGYAWTGKNAIMKYDYEMAAPLTLKVPLANGKYAVVVKDVFTNNSANANFPFTIQGQAVNVVATDANAWTKDYLAGEFEVTDGILTIIVGNPYVGTGAWLGFSGFSILHGMPWVRDHEFTIMGLAANVNAYAPVPYRDANMSAFLEWQPNNEYHLAQNATVGLPWFLRVETVDGFTITDLHNFAEQFSNQFANNYGWIVRDEPSRIDFDTVAEEASWYHRRFPTSIIFTTMGGGDFQSNPAGYASDMVNIIKPDVLVYDTYPFTTNGGTSNMFPNMNALREEGLKSFMPYWVWIQSYENSEHNLRMPSESDLRMQTYLHLAYGYKGIIYFTYTPEVGTAMVNGDQTLNQIYYDAQALNLEVVNVGETLKGLTSIGVGYVAGIHEETYYESWDIFHLYPQTRQATNSIPAGVSNWTQNTGGGSHIVNIDIAGLGEEKNAVIGFFRDDDDQRYFMLTNLMHGANMTALAGTAQFQVQFDATINDILRINRLTGQTEILTLNNHVLSLTLGGGTGDLFKYNTSNPTELIAGDANGDQMVDVGDLGILAANYSQSDKTWAEGDFNGDGVVDVGDLGILAAHYGEGVSAAVDFNADYATVFGTTVMKEDVSADEIANSECNALGFPLVVGLVLMGMMLVKLEEQEVS
jgi:hypothetical protein